jgi:hypothetical protein
LAYSKGHSAIDLHVAEVIAPAITLYYIPPVKGIVFFIFSWFSHFEYIVSYPDIYKDLYITPPAKGGTTPL